MWIFLAIGGFVGIALGLRFSVFVLVPAVLLAVTAVTLSNLANHQNVDVLFITALATIALLQFGYIAGRIAEVAAQARSQAS
jgi:hypothetical protein